MHDLRKRDSIAEQHLAVHPQLVDRRQIREVWHPAQYVGSPQLTPALGQTPTRDVLIFSHLALLRALCENQHIDRV
ncbi:MAG: hypothetical protein O2822_04895 [Chloroflexi bacterium]|nr:hypothetical protein [Chloroflexota bacterium]